MFSFEHLSNSLVSVVDGKFVTYVVIPPAAPRSKSDVGMVLQFAKVDNSTLYSDIRTLWTDLKTPHPLHL